MSNSIDAILSQYQKNTQPTTSGNRVSSEERLKKYFTTILPKGTSSGQKRIRILPASDGSPFKEVEFHEVQVGGKWLKLYDPSQDGDRSPLNDVRSGLLATGSESDKVLARNYKAKKFYIVKVIDRDNEQDGPKFWRFKHNYKGDGILDKIIPIIRSKGDITDVNEGRDIILSLALLKAPNGKEYTSINSIIQEDKAPLHEDASISAEWVNDPQTWRDVYSVKPINYLEMVASGETPIWSSDQKKFVSQNDEDTNFGSNSVDVSAKVPVEDPQAKQSEDDDLPF